MKFIIQLLLLSLFLYNFNALSQTALDINSIPIKIVTTSSGCNIYTRNSLEKISVEYIGECSNGFASGQGFLKFYNNGILIYTHNGFYSDGFPNGPGTQTFDPGSKSEMIREGNFRNGLLHGKGSLSRTDTGSRHIGEFYNGVPHGLGTTTFRNGDKWIGDWKNGIRNGQFTLEWADGQKYVGAIYDKVREGKGIQTIPPNWKYEGEWRNDKRDGFGVLTIKNSSVYSGDFKDDKYHGKGIITYQNAGNKGATLLKYEGDFKDYLRNGYGVATYSNGHKYSGNYKDDLYHGKGEYITDIGVKLVGEWRNDKLEGEVIEYSKDGTIVSFYNYINGKRLDFNDIIATYNANQARFHSIYRGNTMSGRAIVDSVKADFLGSGEIFFINLISFESPFVCSTRNRDMAAKFDRNQRVFFKGSINDVTFNKPQLRDCEIKLIQ